MADRGSTRLAIGPTLERTQAIRFGRQALANGMGLLPKLNRCAARLAVWGRPSSARRCEHGDSSSRLTAIPPPSPAARRPRSPGLMEPRSTPSSPTRPTTTTSTTPTSSDFFYVWLKRTIGQPLPGAFCRRRLSPKKQRGCCGCRPAQKQGGGKEKAASPRADDGASPSPRRTGS